MKTKQYQTVNVADNQVDKNYRSVFEDIAEPMVVWAEGGHILGVNPAACDFFGYLYDDLKIMFIDQLESQEDPFHTPKQTRILLEQGHAGYEIYLEQDNRSPLHVEVSVSKTVWDGKIAFCSCYRPIHKHNIDRSFADHEVRLRAITDSVKDAILMMNEKGVLFFWNPAAEHIFGYTAPEVIGRNLHTLLAPSRYHQMHAEAFKKFQQLGQGNAIDRTIELEACHKDGHEISIELSLSKLLVDGAWHSIGIIRDITERKKAEVKLRQSEERFRALHNASFGGIIIHDKGLILDCNQGLSEISGYTFDELVGMDGLQLIAPDWRNIVQEKIYSGYEETYEVEGLRKDGTIYPLSIRGSNIPYKGHEVRVTEFRDITERKKVEEERRRLEAQLTQAHKMESIGALAGGIAHDFNNILGAILGYVQLSQNVTPATSPAAQFLDKALEGIQRATSLVGQILAFSRQEDAQQVPLEVAPIINEVVKLLRPILPSTIKITKHIQEGTRAISADPTQVHQILMNLCTNAFHVMEKEGGTLTIELMNKELLPQDVQQYPGVAPGPFIDLTIGDTGPGIAEELIDKIFDPYFTTKPLGKGSGMGLSIVHGIVQSYGGFIKVENKEGTGAWFHIHLPAITQMNKVDENHEEEGITGGCERILLVDDEELVADMTRSMLVYLGYDVTVFTNSLESVNVFSSDPSQFDMVITDQTMPVMTGVDIAQRMLKIRPDIPIIICTGYSSTVSEGKVLAMGVKGFAMKPLAIKDISILIRKILDDES